MKKLFLLVFILMVMLLPSYNVVKADENQEYSEETQEWLTWFNSLSFEERVTVNYRPAELLLDPNYNEISFLEAATVVSSSGINEYIPDDPGTGGTMVVGGYELSYNPSYWNGWRINYANCYLYALNFVSSSTSFSTQQPGYKAGSPYSYLTGSSIISAVQQGIPYLSNVTGIRPSSSSEVPGVNEYKVALVIAPGYDYHWYRQNPDSTWSHKRGHTAVIKTDASGNTIYNPQTCNRNYGSGLNYSTFVGFYIISY